MGAVLEPFRLCGRSCSRNGGKQASQQSAGAGAKEGLLDTKSDSKSAYAVGVDDVQMDVGPNQQNMADGAEDIENPKDPKEQKAELDRQKAEYEEKKRAFDHTPFYEKYAGNFIQFVLFGVSIFFVADPQSEGLSLIWFIIVAAWEMIVGYGFFMNWDMSKKFLLLRSAYAQARGVDEDLNRQLEDMQQELETMERNVRALKKKQKVMAKCVEIVENATTGARTVTGQIEEIKRASEAQLGQLKMRVREKYKQQQLSQEARVALQEIEACALVRDLFYASDTNDDRQLDLEEYRSLRFTVQKELGISLAEPVNGKSALGEDYWSRSDVVADDAVPNHFNRMVALLKMLRDCRLDEFDLRWAKKIGSILKPVHSGPGGPSGHVLVPAGGDEKTQTNTSTETKSSGGGNMPVRSPTGQYVAERVQSSQPATTNTANGDAYAVDDGYGRRNSDSE